MLDWNKLNIGTASDTVIEPRKIFSSLVGKSERWAYLRDVQSDVLDKWYERRNQKDNVIKMNTGSGKTAVGLLFLKSSLNEKVGPAVYITPDKYLTDQVVSEAHSLNIGVTQDESSVSFLNGKAILVCNIDKVVNGLSKFGVGFEGQKISIGALLVDDVHSCLQRVRNKFTISAPVGQKIYTDLLRLFRGALQEQSQVGVLDLESREPNRLMLVPFWAWKDKSSDVLRILHENKEDIKFEWPLVSEVIKFCRCIFGGTSLEISPACIPIEVIPSFSEAKRRIYMTATLADDSVLVTDFNAAPDQIESPIEPKNHSDIGDRLILIPQELNTSTTEDEIKLFLKEKSKKYNVVVLVPSDKRAEFWKDVEDQRLAANNLSEGVNTLKTRLVGLTVMANKYDGIDLPGDACRILVIDGLPEIRGHFARIQENVLADSDRDLRTQIQRIEQGMGRGVRSNEDYCVVFLMGAKLTKHLHDARSTSMFSPATLAQLDLSHKVAEQLQGKKIDELDTVIAYCLERNSNWLSASKNALLNVQNGTTRGCDRIAFSLRKAFDYALSDDFQHAVKSIEDVANSEPSDKVKGWLKQILAEYMYHINPADAQRVLGSARELNKCLLRPIGGVCIHRLQKLPSTQVGQVIQLYNDKYITPSDFVIEVNSIVEDLVFQEDTAKQFEHAIAQLGHILGFETQLPEEETGRGPDVLWALGGLKYLVIECKNGSTSDKICKTDCNQLNGSAAWFQAEYDHTSECTPVMIHPISKIDYSASLTEDARIINRDMLESIKENFKTFAYAVSASGFPINPNTIRTLLKQYSFTAEEFCNKYTISPKSSK